jgi:hypothetical protein
MRDSAEPLPARQGSLLIYERCDKAIINTTRRSATRLTNKEDMAQRDGFKIVAAGPRVPTLNRT